MVVISLFIGVISLSMFKAFDDLQEEKALKVKVQCAACLYVCLRRFASLRVCKRNSCMFTA